MKVRKTGVIILAVLFALVALMGCKKKDKVGAKAYAEITVEIFDRGTDGGKSDPTKNNYTDWIAEKVLEEENIKVTFIPVSRWDEHTALTNLMAAGTPPDVCVSYSGELISNYSELGGLLDLEPYIDTLLPDLKAFLGPDQALPGRDFIRRNQDTETGKIFSIPARRVNIARLNLFIRKDWLDALGLPIPNSADEYYNALVAFKEQDPGNVGKDKVIPFTMTSDIRWTAGSILEPFIDPNLSTRDYWVNTVVDRYFFLPGYKEGFRFLNKMYNANLIDKDFPLYKSDDDLFNLVKNGVVGSFCHNWDQIYRDDVGALKDLQQNVPGAMLIAIDPIKSSDGIAHKITYDAAGVNFFVPTASKNPEAALRYINWLSRYENLNFLQIGPEGIVHDMEDGVPKIKTTTGLWIQNSPQNIDYTLMVNGLDLGDPDINAKALASGYPWPAEMVGDAYLVSTSHAKPGPVVPVSLTAAGPIFQDLVDKCSALSTQSVIAKTADFDATWEKGIQDLLDSGAKAVIDERAAKYIEQ